MFNKQGILKKGSWMKRMETVQNYIVVRVLYASALSAHVQVDTCRVRQDSVHSQSLHSSKLWSMLPLTLFYM